MSRWVRPPIFAIAATLLGLIALLATLQYRWLGRVSDAERERLKTTLNARATAFAQDFDRELTLAYMLFQFDPLAHGDEPRPEESLPVRIGTRYDRWQTTARYPRLIKEWFVATGDAGSSQLQRFSAATRFVEPVDWPASLAPVRRQIVTSREEQPNRGGTFFVRTIAAGLWEDVPALVVPSAAPVLFLAGQQLRSATHVAPTVSYTILVLDRDYIVRELLPALTQQHFRGIGEDFDYQLAVVKASGDDLVYHSTSAFSPKAGAATDASAELFQVRMQEFPQLVADVRRFTALIPPGTATYSTAQTVTTFTLATPGRGAGGDARQAGTPPPAQVGETRGRLVVREAKPVSVIVGQASSPQERAAITTAITRNAAGASGKWRLLVKHPAGSLEAAVNSARWRNLLISSSILGVLAASMVLLVVSTRKSQEVARQQMEFVAAVSHELRTPLAVVRSAGDNLADGLVRDEQQVRKYGELVRGEGRRLTEMVEQILEFAGIHSGQRSFVIAPVRVDTLIASVVSASQTLIDAARLQVEVVMPDDLPPVAGDESALRRVFQNLIGNAIKYGADGGWIGVAAERAGSEVRITVGDRGIGIAPADQQRIFEPFYRAADVVAAQVQGAGLGLSLVHRIVAAHGGRITVKSAKGSGSEFTVHLPAATEHQARQSDGLPAPAAQSHQS